LRLNLETMVMDIAGEVPNNGVALDMARRAVDECEYTCLLERQAARAKQIVPAAHISHLHAITGRS